MRRMWVGVVATAALVTWFIASASSQGRPTKIGVVADLSGPFALIGTSALAGIRLAVDDVRASGGLLGRPVELVVTDAQGKPDVAAQNVKRLTESDRVDLLLATSRDTQFLAMSPLANQARVPMVAALVRNAPSEKTRLLAYVFRTSATARMEGRAAAMLMADWAPRRVITVGQDTPTGREATAAFVGHLKRSNRGVEIVEEIWLPLGTSDLESRVTWRRSADAVFLGLLRDDLVRVAKSSAAQQYFRAVGGKVVAVLGAGSRDVLAQLGNASVEGMWGTTLDIPSWREAPAAYASARNRLVAAKVDVTAGIEGYVAAQVLFEGVRAAGSVDRDRVKDRLAGLTVDSILGRSAMRRKDQQLSCRVLLGQLGRDGDRKLVVVASRVVESCQEGCECEDGSCADACCPQNP